MKSSAMILVVLSSSTLLAQAVGESTGPQSARTFDDPWTHTMRSDRPGLLTTDRSELLALQQKDEFRYAVE